MEFKEHIIKTRTYRRFDESHRITPETLSELVDCARLTPSNGNMQPLKYTASCSPEWNNKIFSTLGWAGYLKDWPGPGEGERPTAYIVILTDTGIKEKAEIDVGIAAQTILLGAVSRGLGGCMLGSIRGKELREILSLPDHLSISLVIALGKPIERVVLEDIGAEGSIKYYRTPDGTHHVPKRTSEEILLKVLS